MPDTATIVTEHHDEIVAARQWHQTAPPTRPLPCPRCQEVTRFVKSRWKAGRRTCEACGWHRDEAI